ncbi:MAG: hypothetical protein OEM02_03410 [Desulfobulbaceae bacterium]|nr:hypothetical protein [Desulfobulbaceae bacterium]
MTTHTLTSIKQEITQTILRAYSIFMRNFKILDLANNLSDTQQRVLEKKIIEAANNGRLPCGKARIIAQTLNIPLEIIGHVADKLRIRISQCQLGCF